MGKNFKKGDLVTHLCSWDNKGSVTFRDAIVHSCGKKQMVLTDALTGEEMGRHFDPETGANRRAFAHSLTCPRLTETEAREKALELGAEVVAERGAALERLIAKGHGCKFYRAGLLESLAKLHAPLSLSPAEADAETARRVAEVPAPGREIS